MSATVFALMAVVMHNLPGVRDECGRAGARPSRMGAAILVARDADERPFNGGRRLRREDGFHADGVVNEFEEI